MVKTCFTIRHILVPKERLLHSPGLAEAWGSEANETRTEQAAETPGQGPEWARGQRRGSGDSMGQGTLQKPRDCHL